MPRHGRLGGPAPRRCPENGACDPARGGGSGGGRGARARGMRRAARSESRPRAHPAGGRDRRARAAARRRRAAAGAGARRERVRHRDHGAPGAGGGPAVRRPGHSADRRSHQHDRRRRRGGHPRAAAGRRLHGARRRRGGGGARDRRGVLVGRGHGIRSRCAGLPGSAARPRVPAGADGGCRDPGVHRLPALSRPASRRTRADGDPHRCRRGHHRGAGAHEPAGVRRLVRAGGAASRSA